MARLVITGATGFVGRATVSAALEAGHEVIALGRSEAQIDGATYHKIDLSAPGDALVSILDGTDAVIHAAAAMAGDDASHAKDTVAPTRAVLNAITTQRFVLVSSLSVYGYAAVPEGTMLDELTPIEPDPGKRDAYARAKIAQERMAIEAAQHRGLDVWLIRPGAIYGPGRTDTARLGISVKGRMVSPGGDPTIPAVDVAHVGRGLVAAATATTDHTGDYPMGAEGRAIAVNLVDQDPPRQSDWLETSGRSVRGLPKKLVFKSAEALDLAGDLIPFVARRTPTILKAPTLAARFKHLKYATARAEDLLGLKPGDGFAATMARYLDETP